MTFTQRLSVNFSLACIAVAFSAHSRLAAEEAYGHLRGRFVYDGVPPAPKPIVVKGLAIGHDELLEVNPENRGIANVGVWLDLRRSEPMPPIHPSYAMHVAKPDGPRTKQVTIIKGRFEPHFLLLRTDETLAFVNADKDGSALKADLANNPPLAFLLPPGGEKRFAMAKTERVPGFLRCDVHPWMRACILVKNHPYVTVTDNDGAFEIRNLPAGEREFRCWHESAGYVREVKRGGAMQRLVAGRVKFKIPANDTLDLGDLSMAPEEF